MPDYKCTDLFFPRKMNIPIGSRIRNFLSSKSIFTLFARFGLVRRGGGSCQITDFFGGNRFNRWLSRLPALLNWFLFWEPSEHLPIPDFLENDDLDFRHLCTLHKSLCYPLTNENEIWTVIMIKTETMTVFFVCHLLRSNGIMKLPIEYYIETDSGLCVRLQFVSQRLSAMRVLFHYVQGDFMKFAFSRLRVRLVDFESGIDAKYHDICHFSTFFKNGWTIFEKYINNISSCYYFLFYFAKFWFSKV